MVRYLKIKIINEDKKDSLPLPFSDSLTRTQKVTETLKTNALETSDINEPTIGPPSRIRSNHFKKNRPIFSDSSERNSEDLVQKVQDLESKLLDYEELVRKKDTAQKLALQLQEEEMPAKKISVMFKNAEVATKRFHAQALKKYLYWSNFLILIISIVAVVISTYVFLMLTKSNYELTVVYRLIQNKKKVEPQMINRLVTYMTSNQLLTQIIEETEKFNLNENVRRQQLEAWLSEYRDRIKVYPDTQRNVIKLTVLGDTPEKAASVVRKITEAYSELINTQKSLDDYLQYLRKAIDKSSVFKTLDKVILLNAHQKNSMNILLAEKKFDLKAQLTSLEEELANVQQILSADQEEKYLSALARPQSVDDYILLGFKSRLFDLETASFIAEKTNDDIVLINGYSTELLQVRSRIETLIKSRLGKEFAPNEKQELALTLRKMSIEIKREALHMLMAGQYGIQEDFSINQKEYLVNQKNIHQLLDNYGFYINSKEVLNQVLKNSAADQNYSRIKSSPWVKYQWRPVYWISLCSGMFLGLMLIFIRNLHNVPVP